jgi:hypothetical protein
MLKAAVFAAMLAALSWPLAAQEKKPVPKDSMRISMPGCTKGYIFTAGARNPDAPNSAAVPEGTHFRMNGAKSLISDIKAHEGAMIEITGLVKRGQFLPDGVAVGGHVRVGPGPQPGAGGLGAPTGGQIMIDVESWRPAAGDCPSR